MVHLYFRYSPYLSLCPSPRKALPAKMETGTSWIDILFSYLFTSIFISWPSCFALWDFVFSFTFCILKFQLSYFLYQRCFLLSEICFSSKSLLFFCSTDVVTLPGWGWEVFFFKKVVFYSLHCFCTFCAFCSSAFFCSFYCLSFVRGPSSDIWWFLVFLLIHSFTPPPTPAPTPANPLKYFRVKY